MVITEVDKSCPNREFLTWQICPLTLFMKTSLEKTSKFICVLYMSPLFELNVVSVTSYAHLPMQIYVCAL